jgi:hypothetical protein
MVLIMRRRRNHSPLLYLVGLIAALTLIRWAGIGSQRVLEFVTLGLIALLLVWGHRITHTGRRHSQRDF